MSTDRHLEHFPILRSVLSAEALADTVAGAYGLESVRCRLIKAVILDTYHLTAAGEPYIVRVYPAKRRNLGEIKAELELLLYSIPLFQVAQNIWVLGVRASYLNEWGTTHFSSQFVDHVLDFIKHTGR